MKSYFYEDQDGVYIYTEDAIIAEYWDYWTDRLEKLDREHLISRENCIEDWVIVNWAQPAELLSSKQLDYVVFHE